jgi:hypothetical protein
MFRRTSLWVLCVCFMDRQFSSLRLHAAARNAGHAMRLILVVTQNVIPLLKFKALKELREENRCKDVTPSVSPPHNSIFPSIFRWSWFHSIIFSFLSFKCCFCLIRNEMEQLTKIKMSSSIHYIIYHTQTEYIHTSEYLFTKKLKPQRLGV